MTSTAWDAPTGPACRRIIAKRATLAGMARAAAGGDFHRVGCAHLAMHQSMLVGRAHPTFNPRSTRMKSSSTNRRAVLGALASAGGLPLLFPDGSALAQQAPAQQAPAGRDVIRELGVRPCINAAGTYTALTGSLMLPEVVAGIQVASRQYVRLNELHDAVGNRIAELLKCPAAMVSAGCASALSLATAACVAG